MNSSDDPNHYFTGKKLYGDDFDAPQIAAWFREEAEAYADLGAGDASQYTYVYHALNQQHGFAHTGKHRFNHALGLGSAYGDEFLPLISRIDKLTILDPSDSFAGTREVHGVPCDYQKPDITGNLVFNDNSLDLVTSLGVLHHIPNVSHVIRECHRCLRPGGLMLLREPIVSMGDWTRPRPGLTRHERGIPLSLLEEACLATGFGTSHRSLCLFPALPKLAGKLGIATYNSRLLTWLDSLVCQLTSFNTCYHRTSTLSKMGPSCVYLVLEKRAS